MADNDNTPSLAQIAAHQSIRQAFLTDFDARVTSAGGVDAFLYIAPQREIDWMLQRSSMVLRDAEALPEEGVAGQVAIDRVHDVVAVLEEEAAVREMIAQEAIGPNGELAYHVPEAVHLRAQETLARHLEYHETRLSAADYRHGEGFDHIAAASAYRKHLLALQLDAYDRQLEITPSKDTRFVLGSQLHDRATRAVLESQAAGTGEWNQWTLAERLTEHPEYLRDAIDQHRQFRADLARDSDEGVYPGDLPEDMWAAWDLAAAEVDAGVDRAYGREPAPAHVAAAEEAVALETELQPIASEPVAARDRLTSAQQQALAQLAEAAARSYQGLGEPHIDEDRAAPRVMQYSAADDTPGTVYARVTAAVTGVDDPAVAPLGDYRVEKGYIALEPDGLLRPVATRVDEAVARAVQRHDRDLNVAFDADGQLEQYEATIEGRENGGIRYEARSAKGIRDHFNLEDESIGGGRLRVRDANRVLDLYTVDEVLDALSPGAENGIDPVAAEADMPRWRAQEQIVNDWLRRAEILGGEDQILAVGSHKMLTEFEARIEQVGTSPAPAPDGQDHSADVREIAGRIAQSYQRTIEENQRAAPTLEPPSTESPAADIYTRPDLERLSGLEVAEGLKAAGLDESIANRLSEDQLHGVYEWASEQTWVAQREYEPAEADRWLEISHFAQEELAVRQVAAQEHYVHTPARDAYMTARLEAGTVGAALADPRMKLALDLAGLKDQHARTASSLSPGYDPARRPPFWRVRQRAQWDAQKPIAEALEASSQKQARLREQIGPDADALAKRARDLVEVRNDLLGRTAQLQRNAIEEEIGRQPEWLDRTLGPRPETGAARWQSLASDLAANRLRYGITDDADPGIRPDQTMLADKVTQFRAEVGLAQAAGPIVKAELGFGM